MYFDIKAGLIQGRNHIIDSKNGQDAFKFITGQIGSDPFVIGFIADGCGEGEKSETGAYLGVNYACNATRNLIGLISIEKLNKVLYQQVRRMLTQVVSSQDFIDPIEEVNFIKNHLLFTLLGFVIYKGKCIVLSSGDGVIVINDDIHLLDEANRPSYIAYHSIDRKFLSTTSKLSTKFESIQIDLKKLERLAIGSDAWADVREKELLSDQIWNLGENPRSLNRLMRRLSNTEKMFKDDAVLITVEFPKEE